MSVGNPKKLVGEARRVLKEGNREYARVLLTDAFEASPKEAGAALLLADLYLTSNRMMEAIETLAAHLAANSRSTEAAQTLSSILAAATPVSFATVDVGGLAAALDLDRVTPEPLARAAGLLIRERGGISAADHDPALKRLLTVVLRAAPITEPDLEAQLAARRRECLLGGAEATQPATPAAIVHQAWLNEYVWPVSAEEQGTLDRLDPTSEMALLMLAMYEPVLAKGDETGGPGTLGDLAETIRREAHEMARADQHLGPAIAAADETGAAVAAQYEDNPYPRWRWVQPPPVGTARKMLAGLTPDHPDDLKGGWEKGRLRILIAGCGTGQQAIQAAQAWAPRADLLAFDFSRTSLRYAAMKARHHRAGNLRFRQADILDLPAFDRPFDQSLDLIECVGVLHHLADPFAGWRALLDRLKPGGLMYLGLYSAVARRELGEFRQKLAADGIDPTNVPDIREVRARILSSPTDDFERSLAQSADFYTLSNVRDLLFHAHEAPVTLAEIGAFLDAEDLDFLGMDVRPHVAEAFSAAEGKAAFESLDAWQRFETRNPQTFDGMYLFWVQKPL